MDRLIALIKEKSKNHTSIVVAMSGGVDSGLVAYAAYKALGDASVAVTVHSELTADRDGIRAAAVAEYIGIPHEVLSVSVLGDPVVSKNESDRCYRCKLSIFRTMIEQYGNETLILDGTNADDDPARPGLRAVREFSVFSPLQEAGIVKTEVREMAKKAGLPNWDAPSESCLATRFPVGATLTQESLQLVQAMESYFHGLGVETLRCSHDNLMATVSYLPQYAKIIDENRDNFMALIKKIGLRSCTFKEWAP